MTPEETIGRAAGGDVAAFTDLVGHYQGMAFGYALAILRDFHLAQDATQEAFVAAYFGLASLEDPARFPQWLRGIVRHQCWRFLRRRRVPTIALDGALALPAPGPTPERQVEERDGVAGVLAAIDALPEALRAVTVLFYLEDYTQREIAAFLALPVTTVNNRLHAARKRLKEGRFPMTREAITAHGLPAGFAARIGEIVRARGPIVEVRFAAEAVPPVLNALTSAAAGQGDDLAVVIQHLPDHVARGLRVAAPGAPPVELAAGMAVADAARPIGGGVDAATIGAAIAQLGARVAVPELLETGIKALDLLCPLPRRGTIGLFGDRGAGKAVLITELHHRLTAPGHDLALFTFIEAGEEVAFYQPYAPPSSVGLQSFAIAADQRAALAAAEVTGACDAIVALTRELAALRLYPALDPATSTSRLLDPAIVGAEHCRVAGAVRDLLRRYPEAAGDDDPLAARARRLRRFLTQPMYVAEAYARTPGVAVRREETVRDCAALLRGDYDGLPEAAFAYVGTLAQAVEKAATLAAQP